MMRDNKVNVDGSDIYLNKIYYYADEYMCSISENREEAKKKLSKKPMFKGLLKYIYKNLFKPNKGENVYNNSIKRNSNLNYDDIDLLNDIWDIYTELCYSNYQDPSLLNFSIMTGISVDWMNDVEKGNIRAGSDGTSSAHCQSVKKWLKECEAGLYDGASSGNPGAMFLLKANYGYSEQPQRIQIIDDNAPQHSRAEIAAQFAQYKELPEVPELSDN